MAELLPGAEPMSRRGGLTGVLVIHGFTGSPCSMRPVAQALADAGHTIELPRLPGHGTSIDDMLTTSWSDWSTTVLDTFGDLASRCERVMAVGLSMGGTLALWLAATQPGLAGVAVINPLAKTDPEMVDQVRSFVEAGGTVTESIGNDIAKPGVDEVSYDQTPLAPLLSLFGAVDELQPLLADITAPTLVLTSRNDHVVPPHHSEHVAASVSGSVDHRWLDQSYHVATLDYDQPVILDAVAGFVDDRAR